MNKKTRQSVIALFFYFKNNHKGKNVLATLMAMTQNFMAFHFKNN